jgi:pimeloyl-ACP methyl ester carboxylesterase
MSRFINYNSKKIYYKIEGEGDVVVFVHGFLENKQIWADYSSKLCKSNKVISIDLPGHGESDNISNVHTMELFADVIFELLNYLSISKISIIGHSMGGYVSLVFAKKYPDLTKSLCLFHSHAAADSPEAKINRARAAKVVSENHQGFIASFIPDLFTKTNQQKFAEKIENLKSQAKKTTKDGVIASLFGMREREDMLKFISETNIPILFIIGKHDSRIPISMMKEQIFLPKNSSALILEEVAHMGYIENKNACFNAIKSFVNS